MAGSHDLISNGYVTPLSVKKNIKNEVHSFLYALLQTFVNFFVFNIK